MESSVEELGDLKYSIALEIPLEEIKPTYDAVYKELKQIDFMEGKFEASIKNLKKLASTVFDQENILKAGLKSVLKPQCRKKLWTE